MNADQTPESSEIRPLAQYIVLMGVAGSGKTAVGSALAGLLQTSLIEGDDYHPRANIEKLQRGLPLVDEDRWPWIAHVAGAMRSHFARCEQSRRQDRKAEPVADRPGAEATDPLTEFAFSLATCSTMRRQHRDYLVNQAGEPILFVELSAARELIRLRIREREDHYQASLNLDSQLAMLEPIQPDELGMVVDASLPLDEVVDTIRARLLSG